MYSGVREGRAAGGRAEGQGRQVLHLQPPVRPQLQRPLVRRAGHEEKQRLIRPGVDRLAERKAQPQRAQGGVEAVRQDRRARRLVQARQAGAGPDGGEIDGRAGPQGDDLGRVLGLEADELDGAEAVEGRGRALVPVLGRDPSRRPGDVRDPDLVDARRPSPGAWRPGSGRSAARMSPSGRCRVGVRASLNAVDVDPQQASRPRPPRPRRGARGRR